MIRGWIYRVINEGRKGSRFLIRPCCYIESTKGQERERERERERETEREDDASMQYPLIRNTKNYVESYIPCGEVQ